MTTPLIINPSAGGGTCLRRARPLVQRLRASGLEVEIQETTHAGHATELAKAWLNKGVSTVLCAGGDGTTFEVLNGLFPHDSACTPRLGCLPLGTGNSFLRDFDACKVDTVIEAIQQDRIHRVDVVRLTHADGELHYLNLFGIGFVSDVATLTNTWFKPLGPAGYAFGTLIEVARLKSRPLPHARDDGPMDRDPVVFLSFSNSKFTGGAMKMAPHASLQDGKVDIIKVGALGRRELLKAFPSIYRGEHIHHPANDCHTAARVAFDLDGPIDAMIDGEVLRLDVKHLEVLPQALEIYA